MNAFALIPLIWFFLSGWISKKITNPPSQGSFLFFLLWFVIFIGVPYILFELIIGIPFRDLSRYWID